MRILDVSTWTPSPPENGSSMRIHHVLRALSREHEVRQFSQPGRRELRRPDFTRDVQPTPTYREHRYVHPLSVLACEWCRRTWVFQFVLAGAVLRATRPALLREWVRWADVVVVEFPWQFGAVARLRPRVPLVFASHNAEVPTRASSAVAVGSSPERSRLLRYVARLEREAVARADLIFVVSERDRRDYLERYGADPARLVVAPNGSDSERFAPVPPARRAELRQELGLPDRPTAVYLAGVPKPPDRVGLAWIRRLAQAVPDVTFLVVGGVLPAPEVDGNLVATGSVEEPWRYLEAADVSVCPIEHGGGTKIKVCDSLATGLPTLVFPETIQGTAFVDGEHVVVVEKDVAAIERALRRVLADAEGAARLGATGRAFVVDHLDWRLVARRVEGALLELAAGSKAVRPSVPAQDRDFSSSRQS